MTIIRFGNIDSDPNFRIFLFGFLFGFLVLVVVVVVVASVFEKCPGDFSEGITLVVFENVVDP